MVLVQIEKVLCLAGYHKYCTCIGFLEFHLWPSLILVVVLVFLHSFLKLACKVVYVCKEILLFLDHDQRKDCGKRLLRENSEVEVYAQLII